MKLKKRRKSSRRRGTRLCGYAAKKHKGSGNRGGPGMAGSGTHKKTYVIRYLWPYFGRKGQVHNTVKIYEEINLGNIERNINSFIKKGIAKESKEGLDLNLMGYKILGEGEVKKKMTIRAFAFSNSAKEKIEKAGGKAIIEYQEAKTEEKPKAKAAKKEAVKAVKKPEIKSAKKTETKKPAEKKK